MTPNPTELMPFNCLLDADGSLHLDLDSGETLRLSVADTRKLARFLMLLAPVLEALPA